MEKGYLSLLLLFIFVVINVCSSDPTVVNLNNEKIKRPVISGSFYARVRATLYNSSIISSPTLPYWLGGGIFAHDDNKGFERIQLHMKGKSSISESKDINKDIFIHNLDRYDLQYSFKISPDRTCKKSETNGDLRNPFQWVERAHFSGVSEYNGIKLETWEYVDDSEAVYKLSVKKGTNEPVVIVLGNEIAEKGMFLEMVVMEWKERVRPHMLSFIPMMCGAHSDVHLLGDVNAVVDFADNNWNCADPACDQTVPAGTGQPGYACAEFTARSLAAGGYIPGLSPSDDQSAYISYSYGGNTYSLIDCSGLSPALTAIGFSSESNDPSSVVAGCAAFGDGGDGYFSHAVIGVGNGIDDAHNNARYHYPVADSLYGGIDAVQCPNGAGTASSSSSSSGSGTYYSSMNEPQAEEALGGKGSLYDTKGKVGSKTENMLEMEVEPQAVRLVEEKSSRKFE